MAHKEMEMGHKAITEFCWCGVRYVAGQVVRVDPRSAKKLLASRLIYEVPESAIEQDAAGKQPPADEQPPPGEQPPADEQLPADEGQEMKGNTEKQRTKKRNGKPKQTKPPRDKQVTGGRNK